MLLLLLSVLSAMRAELPPDQVTVLEKGEAPVPPTAAIRAGVLGGTCSYTQVVDASGAVESVMVPDCEKVLHAAVRSYAQAFTFEPHLEQGEPAPFAVTDRVSLSPVGPDAVERLDAGEAPVVYPHVHWTQVSVKSREPTPEPSGKGGECRVELLLSPDAELVDVRPAGCPELLWEPTQQAVSQWVFRPPARSSELGPHSVFMSVPVEPKPLEHTLLTVHWTHVKAKHRVEPSYPPQALGQEGRCTVRFFVDPEGKVYDARVEDCPDVFVDSALSAAMESTFKPFKVDGERVHVTFVMAYDFAP